MSIATKTCTGCHLDKDLDSFRRGQGYKDGIRSRCKDCEREQLKSWRSRHPEEVKAQSVRSRRRCPKPSEEVAQVRAMQKRDAYLKRKYGISLNEYIAMREAQNGVCAICEEPPQTTAGQGSHPELVVDHCHKTGEVRGLLCNNCNICIAHALDDPKILRAAIDYVDR